jgi:cell division protein FtsB
VRDIGTRIQRYRLSRYAAPPDRARRRLRWAWVVGGLWLLYVGFLSEHSFYRLWQLRRESVRTRAQLQQARAEVARLRRDADDPARRKYEAERQLRERMQMTRKGEIIYRYEGARPPDRDR